MKKFLLLSVFSILTFFLQAQTDQTELALQLVTKNSASIGLTNEDIANSSVRNSYYNKMAGTQMVYLQQRYKGLEVFNQIHVLAFKNGQVVSVAGGRIASMEKKTSNQTGQPAISPESAVTTALSAKNFSAKESLVASRNLTTGKYDFGKLGIAAENVTAELIWVPLTTGEVKLAWQVYLVPKTTSDYWMIRVDAIANRIVDENNLTVYCDWGKPGSHTHNDDCSSEGAVNQKTIQFFTFGQSPALVGTANYLVVPYPAESPIHPGGTPALRTNPWTMAPGNATSLGWHNDGTTDFTISRGNNVHAYEDRVNANVPGLSATSSTTPDPLNFNFTPDFTVAPTTPLFQQFAITNLFYWNNILHDLTYLYGFTEVEGNFQVSNQGRGGSGNDDVRAEAQDGGGTNNANFSTPADGQRPRMQMYLWTGTPQKDGDVDNGIILHEGGHGVSNRFTGSSVTCLNNNEQMGEGWSDYIALMATQNWATSTLNDGFNSPRGVGTYAMGQPITGVGIRPARYTTNMAVNNYTYTNLPGLAVPHGVGFLWCTILWDMTWNIIQQDGVINPNLFNPAGAGGNSVAFKLVMEGMRIQPCNPGMVDGRNAILQADQILYGGQYRCAIIEAFARRGLGVNASQGASTSVTDGIPDFTGGTSLTLTQNVTQQTEGSNVTYTNTVSNCSPLVNYLLTDTLPTNVTWVSGGTYNAGTRVVSFPVNQASNSTQTYSFTVQINPGSYFPPITLLDEQVLGPAGVIPAAWTATSTTANVWTVHNVRSKSAPFSFFTPNLGVVSDQILATTNTIAVGAIPPPLSFWHFYNLESGYDGAVVEVSTNGGTTWSDLGPFITQNGYNGTIDPGFQNPLANRQAWTASSGGFIKSVVNMSSFANQNIKIRFRMGSDNLIPAVGWNVDDILMKREALVDMRSNLFNASGTCLIFKDTVTIILPFGACVPNVINTPPANTTSCNGGSASFSVTASGSTPTYQWYVSTDGGTTYTILAGQTTATLNLTGLTAGMNNNRYRVVVSNSCSSVTSAAGILTVNLVATINTQPANTSVCPNANATFSVGATGTALTYQWQVSTNGGTTFTDISGATASSVAVNNVTPAMNNNQYRVIVTGSCSATGVTSNAAVLTVLVPVIINTQPASFTGCVNGNSTFSVTATGSNLTYQWQVSNAGGPFVDLVNGSPYSGVTTNTLSISAQGPSLNQNRYRVIVTGTPCGSVTSDIATLTVNQLPVVVVTAAPHSRLYPGIRSTLFTTISPPGVYTFKWYKNGTLVPDSIRDKYAVDIDAFGVYSAQVTDVNGCTSMMSNQQTISDSASNWIFIYPNPNVGRFQVRYFSQQNNTLARWITMWDSKGARVFKRAFTITRPYEKMDVNATNLQSGIYMLELTDINGNRVAVGKVVVL